MSFVGAFDLAGNVREWTATAQDDLRLILGGSYNDPNYAPFNRFAAPPLDRSPGNGFRLAIIRDDANVASRARAGQAHAPGTMAAARPRRDLCRLQRNL